SATSVPWSDAAGARPRFARWLETTNEITRGFLAAGSIKGLINLAGGLPAAETFPAGELAEVAKRAIRDFPGETLGYGPIDGLPALRDELARRFSTPSLRLSRENVLVTTSGMQGLDLVGKILLEPGDLVAGQFPTYLGAIDAWRPREPVYRRLRFGDDAFDPVAGLAGAKFAYSVPNFSNPSGKLVGLPVREALVAAAHQTGTWLVEDDPYGSLYYDCEPLPRLLDLAATSGDSYDGPVIYLGTLSKEIAPGLRIGWVIAASAVIEAMTIAKQGTDMCSSGVTQHMALAAMQSGIIERAQPKIQALYRRRRDALCAAMSDQLSEWFEWEVPVGGMFVWAVARDPGLDTDRLSELALKAGVTVSPSSVFDPELDYRRAIRVNFTLNSPERLAEGIRRLATVLREMPG
ncbi:MAG: PLP-dependent aminotransferase family protein, partial [Halioglobus sp.]|nr:PLP-dependent aminotransferase family protein [Halioglobus sp.]